MARIPFPNYNSQSYYVSRSYAGCTPCPPGDIWCGAMKWGCDVQQTVGEGIDGAFRGQNTMPQKQGNNDYSKAQAKGLDIYTPDSSGKLTPVANNPGTSTYHPAPDPGKNPASGCNNCGSDIWNPAQWGCQIGKLSCEMTSAAGGTFGNFGQYLPYIAVGGAALLLILLIRR